MDVSALIRATYAALAVAVAGFLTAGVVTGNGPLWNRMALYTVIGTLVVIVVLRRME